MTSLKEAVQQELNAFDVPDTCVDPGDPGHTGGDEDEEHFMHFHGDPDHARPGHTGGNEDEEHYLLFCGDPDRELLDQNGGTVDDPADDRDVLREALAPSPPAASGRLPRTRSPCLDEAASFSPSRSFRGAIAGWVFKSGPRCGCQPHPPGRIGASTCCGQLLA